MAKEDIEVIDEKVVKPKKKVTSKQELFEVVPLVDIGLKNGKPEYLKGKPCKVTKEKIENWKKLKLI